MPSPLVEAEIAAAARTFRFNELALAELLTGPSGPTARDLARRAVRVEGSAKQHASQPHRAGPYSGSAPGGGPAVRTGRLRGSITWRLGRDAAGLYADVGSAVTYAPFVELGTSRMEARPFLRPALQAAR